MNLVIDMGNTRTKVAFFDGTQLVEQAYFPVLSAADCAQWWAEKRFSAAILSVSGADTEGVGDFLAAHGFFVRLDHNTPLPIENLYGTPHTLGKDRLAAAAGAALLFPQQACLVIDSGTCVTYDVVAASGAFLGGNIAPGLEMRLKAMHHFTAKLPLVGSDKKEVLDILGKTTQQALQNGAEIGLLAEVEGMVQRFENVFGPLQVILTGGDSAFLKQHILHKNVLQTDILVPIGLNHILNYNKKTAL